MSLRWIQGGFNALIGAGALSDTEAKAAPVAGQAHYITDITVHGGTGAAGLWTIKSGATTLMTIYTALNESKNLHFRVPIKCLSGANINITHAASASANMVICGFTDRG